MTTIAEDKYEVVHTAHKTADDVLRTVTVLRKVGVMIGGIVILLVGFLLAGLIVLSVQIRDTQIQNHTDITSLTKTINSSQAELGQALAAACILIDHANPPLPVPVGCATTVRG